LFGAGDAATSALPIQVPESPHQVLAVVVGYGPVGQSIVRILEDFGLEPVVVEMNLDTVRALKSSGRRAVFGDAGNPEILLAAGIARARYLLVTLPDLEGRIPVLAAARAANPGLRILVRARYLKERAWLEEMGASHVAYEEAEAAVGLAALLLDEIGADRGRIESEARRIRGELSLRAAPPAAAQRDSDT
jgi:CPA2 family monovalent cation:H+ antiporter-2